MNSTKQRIVVLILMFLFPPAGLFLLWKKVNTNTAVKVMFTGLSGFYSFIFCFLFLAVVAGAVADVPDPVDNMAIEKNAKPAETSKPKKTKEPTREELNAKLKKEAVKAEFVKINGKTNEPETKKLKLFVEGKIDNIKNESPPFGNYFLLAQKEADGYKICTVVNVLKVKGLKNGDMVRAYGHFTENDDNGFPKMFSTVIEKIDGEDAGAKEFIKNKIAEIEKKEKKKKYDQWVKDQFSPWDGSHVELKNLIKDNMHDPSSFEHVETRYIEDIVGYNILTISMKYRGNNAFGGKVLNTVVATVGMDENKLVIISNQ